MKKQEIENRDDRDEFSTCRFAIDNVFVGNLSWIHRVFALRSHHVPHLGMYSIVIDLPAFWALLCSCWPLKEEKALTSDVARARVARIAVVFMVDGVVGRYCYDSTMKCKE